MCAHKYTYTHEVSAQNYNILYVLQTYIHIYTVCIYIYIYDNRERNNNIHTYNTVAEKEKGLCIIHIQSDFLSMLI